MKIYKILYETMADGPGIRNSVYVAGCLHKCPGCHNPQTWDYEGAQELSIDEICDLVLKNGCDITISGGDPMYQSVELKELCKKLKEVGRNIWVYTGFKIEDLGYSQREVLKYIDVLVDGPFDIESRETTRFCGSSNQRIIYLENGEIKRIE